MVTRGLYLFGCMVFGDTGIANKVQSPRFLFVHTAPRPQNERHHGQALSASRPRHNGNSDRLPHFIAQHAILRSGSSTLSASHPVTLPNPQTTTDITHLSKRSSVYVAKHSPSSGRHSSWYDLPVERHAPATSFLPGDDLPPIHNLPRPDSTSEATPSALPRPTIS